MSPLLPPRSRSLSLDEIPGLGELSSRPRLTLTAPFGSSWVMSDQGKERVKQEVESPTINSSRSPAECSEEAAETSATSVAALDHLLKDTDHHPLAPLNTEGVQPSSGKLPITPSRPSTPRPLIQNPVHVPRSPDYDEDSDMDFGTPVTSPLIIVPESKSVVVGASPPPISPCPARTAGSKHKIFSPRTETPRPLRGTTPTTVTPGPIASQMVTQQPTIPLLHDLRLVARKTTPQALSLMEAALEDLAQGSGSPMKVDAILLKENEKEARPSTTPNLSITSSQPTLSTQPPSTSPKLVITISRDPPSPPSTPLSAAPETPPALASPSIIPLPPQISIRTPTIQTPVAPVRRAVRPDPLPLSSSPPTQNHAPSEKPPPPPNLESATVSGVGAYQGTNGKDQTPNLQPFTLIQPPATFIDTAMAQLPSTSPHGQNSENDVGPSQASQQQTQASTSQSRLQIPRSAVRSGSVLSLAKT